MNYTINKSRKNNSKKRNSAKNIILPSLNQKIFPENHSSLNSNKIHYINNQEKNSQKLNKNPEPKLTKPQIFLKNHKPYSGNPSIKINNNRNELKVQKRNNIPNSYERDILTANPAIIGNKASFQNYNENINLNNNDNLKLDDKGLIINDVNYKEKSGDVSYNERYKFKENNRRKFFKKIGFGVSKSSPRIASMKIMPNLYENHKQKDMADLSSKIKILLSYGENINMNKNENNFRMKKIWKNYPDSFSFKDNSSSLIREKNIMLNHPNFLGASLIQNSEAQSILIKAVGKLNNQLTKKHPKLKSANINNQINENTIKNKFNKNMLKNISKNSLTNSLKNSSTNNKILNIKLNSEKTQKPQIKPKSKCFISYAYIDYPNLEHRQEMEDFHCIKQALGKKNNLSYFAIFDGHGGKDVAEYLSVNLHHYLIKEINAINFGKNDEENINNIIKSIKTAFINIDQEILSNNNFANDVGSTATLIFIYYNDINNNSANNDDINNIERTLICANIGDSSGYLINKLSIKQITKQHKCEDSNEVQRIKDKGGIVFQGRIFGKLILTRTIGDREMKKYGVLNTPDFFVKKIEKDDLFVIIASDGIWDVVNEDELFNMGNEKELSSEIFSKKIMNIARERDTRDNSSCIVIKLNKNI